MSGPGPWKVISSEVALTDRWITVRRETCCTPSGATIEPYYVLDYPDAVHIIALTGTGQVVVTRQYRHGIQRVCREIPCGRVDASDPSPAFAAERELREETGYSGAPPELLASLASDAGNRSNFLHTYVIRDVRLTHTPRLDPAEEIAVDIIPCQELVRIVERGEMLQTPLACSVLLAARMLGW